MRNLAVQLAAVLLIVCASPIGAQQVARIPAQDRMLPGSPVVQFTIGAEDGEDWELLSRVSQVAFDKQEFLYVLDGGNHRVLVFDPNGKFVRKIGKQGEGPGELMTPVGVAITADGLVAITDLGRQGVSLFKKDGTFVKNLLLSPELGFPVPTAGTAAHPQNGVVVRSMPMMMRRAGVIASSTQINRRSPLTWLKADGTTATLFQIPQPDITPNVRNAGDAGRREVNVRIQLAAFSPATLWSVLPDGRTVAAWDEDYRLQIARNGTVERVIERAIAPRKVTEADKENERERRRNQTAAGAGIVAMRVDGGTGGSRSSVTTAPRPDPASLEQSIREMTFAEVMPVLQRLTVAPRGTLWVQRTGRQVGGQGPIDLIALDGRYLGTLAPQRLPDAISPSGRAAYIERNDMDVEQVVVRRLPPAWLR